MVAAFNAARRTATLVRNPRFRQWSADAQPAGYPDRIVWRRFASPTAMVHAVEDGRADWMYDFVSAAR